MALVLLAAFIVVPVIEIALFIEIGGWIGLWPTIGVVIMTAFAGTTLLRLQGLAVLQRVQESVARNEIPVEEVFTGLCLLVAGALLLTPGFFTDALGFLMFVPSFREIARMGVWRWLAQRGHVSMSGGPGPSGAHPGYPGAGPDGPVIEGDYEEVDPRSPDRDRIGRDEDGKS
jgi:UPF0716 protein FxsA